MAHRAHLNKEVTVARKADTGRAHQAAGTPSKETTASSLRTARLRADIRRSREDTHPSKAVMGVVRPVVRAAIHLSGVVVIRRSRVAVILDRSKAGMGRRLRHRGTRVCWLMGYA